MLPREVEALKLSDPELYACIQAYMQHPDIVSEYGMRYESYGSSFWWRDRTRMLEPLSSQLMIDQHTLIEIGSQLREAKKLYEEFISDADGVSNAEHAIAFGMPTNDAAITSAAFSIELSMQLMPETRDLLKRERIDLPALATQRNAYMHFMHQIRAFEIDEIKDKSREMIGASRSMKKSSPIALDTSFIIALNTDESLARYPEASAEVYDRLESRVAVILDVERAAIADLYESRERF